MDVNMAIKNRPFVDSLTVEEIRLIRDYDYDVTQDMTEEEKRLYYSEIDQQAQRMLQQAKPREIPPERFAAARAYLGLSPVKTSA
jgi:uncharacterized protein (DUF2236 family)